MGCFVASLLAMTEKMCVSQWRKKAGVACDEVGLYLTLVLTRLKVIGCIISLNLAPRCSTASRG